MLSMSGQAIDEAFWATEMLDSDQSWFFRAPLALAYIEQDRLPEAREALQSLYERPGFESKRHLWYIGLLTSMRDVCRGELMLAEGNFRQIIDYDLKIHGLLGDLSGDIVLPELLRIRGQALIALERAGEAKGALVKAREIAEDRGSRLTLWRVLYELSRVADIEDRQDDKEQLLQQSRELIGYIADHCGRPEVRDGFLNHPMVQRALAGD